MKGLRKAEQLYGDFHQFEPDDVGNFAPWFSIPADVMRVGTAGTMYYTSDKLNPETLEDEGCVRYYHEHGPGVMACLALGAEGLPGDGRVKRVPLWIRDSEVLVKLGTCDGFDYTAFDGELEEVRATSPKPEWFCTPCSKALLIIQGRAQVLAIFWGGGLHVEDRGVVG